MYLQLLLLLLGLVKEDLMILLFSFFKRNVGEFLTRSELLLKY